ncbi:MAG: class I SAM-dependent methyltransferase [Planctomycetales bacterium]|nr:class I SAM-dependent methyltransferase [Planctomycetales bacterium]MCA9161580.1 class I SAM-dependent methyltransferase [Planctomycetales bacterium]
MNRIEANTGLRCLRASQRIMQSVVAHLQAQQSGLFMGLLSDSDFQTYDTYPFDDARPADIREHALSGLELWEREVLVEQFGNVNRLLLVAAGGCREMIPLCDAGYDVSAVDYSLEYVRRSNELLGAEGYAARIELAERFALPSPETPFEGAVIARKFYSYIHDRHVRMAFLRQLRRRLQPGAPVLIAYFIRQRDTAGFVVQAAVANLLRRIRGVRQYVEVGDHLDPEGPVYHHHFSQAELRSELEASGFRLEFHEQSWFGYAVARAMGGMGQQTSHEMAGAV